MSKVAGGSAWRTHIHAAEERGVLFLMADCPELYAERFAVLSRAALEIVRRIFRPQVIHCHDWQAGARGAVHAAYSGAGSDVSEHEVVPTIHTVGYQGRFGREVLPAVGAATEPGNGEVCGRSLERALLIL